jgi:prepilin peptidase CpaA
MEIDVSAAAALAIATVACITDLRRRRIPNALTFGAAAAALAWHGASSGVPGMLTGAAGWAVGALLFLPFFLLGGMGAGDVKLLAALGGWLGPGAALWLAVFSSIAGGVLAVGVALAHGYLGTACSNVATLASHWRAKGLRPAPGFTLATSRSPKLAYAIPILLGTVVTLWVR